MNDLLGIFEYSFIQRAFLAGSFVAVSCAALGMFLVLRKMSLIGDGLAHVSFGAIALGLFLGVAPFVIALPLVILGSLFIVKLSAKANLFGDAAIGIVSVVGIASGVFLASLSGGFNVDLFGYLFGNILAVSAMETWLSVGASLAVVLFLGLFYWDLFSATFDEEYATVSGVKTNLIRISLTLLTAMTVVLSIKVVGVLLVSALLILPSVAALQVSKRFSRAILLAIFFSLLSVSLGIVLSFFFDLPAGATIVLLLALCFGLAFAYKKTE